MGTEKKGKNTEGLEWNWKYQMNFQAFKYIPDVEIVIAMCAWAY